MHTVRMNIPLFKYEVKTYSAREAKRLFAIFVLLSLLAWSVVLIGLVAVLNWLFEWGVWKSIVLLLIIFFVGNSGSKDK